jgi:DNA invertase Pin-like site-specific DNA recombinase
VAIKLKEDFLFTLQSRELTVAKTTKSRQNQRKSQQQQSSSTICRNIAYLRVSTALQDADNQKLGIVNYAAHEGLQPVEFFEETTSGKTPIKDRKLQQVIESMVKGDNLIVSELSRLGRNMVEVMTVLDLLMNKECRVYAVKGGYRLDQTTPSKILSMVLCMAAEIERDLISQRTKEALARRKAEGKTLGRPKGSYGVSKLDQYEDEIRRLSSHGVPKAAIARMHSCSWQTVHTWMRRNGVETKHKQV